MRELLTQLDRLGNASADMITKMLIVTSISTSPKPAA